MPNPIEDDERLAAAVGRVASFWAHLEHHFASLFAMLTGMDLTMAVTVFSHFRNVRTQRDVILAVAKTSIRADEEILDKIKLLLSEYDRLSSLRNAIVHAPFGYDLPDSTIYRMEREKVSRPGAFPYRKTYFNVEEVEARIKPINQLGSKVAELTRYIMEESLRKALGRSGLSGLL